MADVNLQLSLKGLQQATKQLNTFAEQGARSVGRLESSFNALIGVGAALGGAFAFRELTQSFAENIRLATIQEDAINSLNQALRSAGVFSEQASQDIQDFASALQASTTVGDETILQLTSLATAFTGNAEAAKELTAAALDFAEGAGISTEEAVRRLGRATQGSTDDIAKFVPEIRNLTKEQLAAGEATRLIAERFEGSAAALRNTFSGAVTASQNSLGDFRESLGSLITQNDSVIAIIQESEKVFQDLQKAVNNNKDEIDDFVRDGLELIGGLAKGFLEFGRAVTRTFIGVQSAIQTTSNFLERGVNFITTIVGSDEDAANAEKRIKELNDEAQKNSIETLEKLAATGTTFDTLRNAIDQLVLSITKVGDEFIDCCEQFSWTEFWRLYIKNHSWLAIQW